MRLLIALMLLCTTAALAQDNLPVGSKEAEPFVEGGHSAAGGRSHTGIFQAGVRFGYAFLDVPAGTLEYTVDLIPVVYVWQHQNTYGASFTPFNLKYNFTHFRRVMPYLELGGGVLFTKHDVPDQVNTVNFTPQAGLGFQFPVTPGSNKHVGVALRYVHISNAGLTVPNPGVNTIEFKLSVGHFCHKGTYTDEGSRCNYVRP